MAIASSASNRIVAGCRAPVVVDAAGAWAAALARTAGVDVPVKAWRHVTAFFGLPTGHGSDFPIVIDEINEMYFRPEGSDLMLVGVEGSNEVGGSPDRPSRPRPPRPLVEDMVAPPRARVPWISDGTFRTAHGGQDGITPDQHPLLGAARTRRVLPPVRVLGDRLQDGSGDRDLPGRAHPRRPDDDGRHLAATRRTGSPPDGRWSPTIRTASSGADRGRGRGDSPEAVDFAPMGDIRILDVDRRGHLRSHPALRGSGLRSPLVRLLGG